MRYYVTVEGRVHEVDLAPGGVRVDGTPVVVDLAAVPGTPARHLLIDGVSHRLTAEHHGADEWLVHTDGTALVVHIVDERTRAIRELTGAATTKAAARPLRAPMPGLVLRVQVEPDARVSAGEGLVIMEAMKMENELRAEADARIARIRVAPGQTVEKGEVLIEFEASAEAAG